MPIQPYTPADMDRLRSIQVRPQGFSHRIRPKHKTVKHPVTGELMKIVLDELGNKVRMRKHGQDAKIHLPHLRIQTRAQVTR